MKRSDIRNVAIIAHVDHGKTTLVDQILKQSGLFRASELAQECILDSNDLERQRGITILAKNIAFRLGDVKVNLMDTPGHADFGGEVERVLKMADGCFLLVDAAEGPLPQTRFVLRKAFACGLRPIVVINKIDRPDARISDVLTAVYDLFIDCDASEEALDFPVIYASGRAGVATTDLAVEPKDLQPLYRAILEHVPQSDNDPTAPLQMLVCSLVYSEFVGRIAVGRVMAGTIRKGQKVAILKANGSRVDDTVVGLQEFDRLDRKDVDMITAGDVCAVIGLDDAEIGDTIADFENPVALPPITVDEPTLDMVFRVNDSPFAGQEGTPITSRQLKDRLTREMQSNVALKVRPSEARGDEFIVSGRGLLHLGILLENMRREGLELAVGKPKVINKVVDGQLHEPIEYLVVEAPADAVGAVMQLVLGRRAECVKMDSRGDMTNLEFTIPARGLIGLRTRLLNVSQGRAIMHHNFHEYAPFKGDIPARVNGVMISTETAKATGYAIEGLQDRGVLMVAPMESVYEGQIVGEHCRDNDLPVNITREKKLTNMRNANAEAKVVIKQPRLLPLEMALEYIEDDELVEITPKSVRLRKVLLKEADRKKADRAGRG
ncbi:MAG: translational GTPase TypA [Gemmataceae bacterium]|nr:translational GTPase TypA [Gemmataceae bacterium]